MLSSKLRICACDRRDAFGERITDAVFSEMDMDLEWKGEKETK